MRGAWHNLQARAAALPAALDGILVQHMVQAGVELLVSAFRDPDFGVMLSLGAGGTLTELRDDIVLVPAPASPATVAHALRRLRAMRKASDRLDHLLYFASRFSALAAAAPWQRLVLEMNPVRWTAEQTRAIDGLLIIEEP